MYLAAYVNKNGVFLIRRDTASSRYFLRKYTFGKENYVEVRITYEAFEKMEATGSFKDSWDMANTAMSEKLEEKKAKKLKKFEGNC